MRRERVERGIYRQANGTYGVYLVVDGKPRYKTVGTKLAEARRQRDLLNTQAQNGTLPRPNNLRFAELAETWIDGFAAQVAAGERSERTLENYRYHLNHHLLPTLGQRRLHQISTDDCALLIAQLRAKNLAPKTIAGALVPLGRVLTLALRRGYINDNPLRRLEQHERPRVTRHEQRVLNHDEISKLLDACLPSYQPLIATALFTGVRLNELLGLTWSDIDLGAGIIHVRQQLSRPRIDKPARRVPLKTSAARRDIPLLLQLAALLKRHKLASRFTTDRDYVFTTSLGTPLGYRNVQRRGLRRAAEKAGLQNERSLPLRMHDLRHTFASHLIIELQLDIAHVSRILGHARPSITLDTYTHLFNHAAHAADIRERMTTSKFGNLLAHAKPGRPSPTT